MNGFFESLGNQGQPKMLIQSARDRKMHAKKETQGEQALTAKRS